MENTKHINKMENLCQKIHLPYIVGGRDKHEYFAHCCGAYVTEKSAIHAMISHLVEKNYISYDEYQEQYKYYKDCPTELQTYNTSKMKIVFEIFEKSLLSENDFTQHLKNITNTKEDLNFVCQNFGDSYFNEGWKWQINYTPILE